VSPSAGLKAARWAALGLAGVSAGLVLAGLLLALMATRLFDFEVLTVRSGSMEPAIGRGDLIVVKPAAIDRVEEGDIVLFAAGGDGIPTVHRVIGINEIELRLTDAATGAVSSTFDYRLVTKGDANAEPDPSDVGASQLMGEVWFTVPGAGGLTAWPLQYLFFGLAALSLAGWAAWEVARRWRKQP
jgi:signal peptidase